MTSAIRKNNFADAPARVVGDMTFALPSPELKLDPIKKATVKPTTSAFAI
jgi:hypothetical protein